MVETRPISQEGVVATTFRAIQLIQNIANTPAVHPLRQQPPEFSKELVFAYHKALGYLSQEGEADQKFERLLRGCFNILARDFLCKAFAEAQAEDFRAANGIAAAILTDDLSDNTHISRQAELYSRQLIEHFRAYGDQEMIDKIIAARSVLWPN